MSSIQELVLSCMQEADKHNFRVSWCMDDEGIVIKASHAWKLVDVYLAIDHRGWMTTDVCRGMFSYTDNTAYVLGRNNVAIHLGRLLFWHELLSFAIALPLLYVWLAGIAFNAIALLVIVMYGLVYNRVPLQIVMVGCAIWMRDLRVLAAVAVGPLFRIKMFRNLQCYVVGHAIYYAFVSYTSFAAMMLCILGGILNVI